MSKTALLMKVACALPILLGLAAFAAAFLEETGGMRLLAVGAGLWCLIGGLALFGFAHLLETVDRIAASARKLVAATAESRAEEREPEPEPTPAEDSGPYTIAQFDHRGYLVHRLNDGTLAVETREGWMRFRSLAELDARL